MPELGNQVTCDATYNETFPQRCLWLPHFGPLQIVGPEVIAHPSQSQGSDHVLWMHPQTEQIVKQEAASFQSHSAGSLPPFSPEKKLPANLSLCATSKESVELYDLGRRTIYHIR